MADVVERLPERIWVERDEEINEKRWFSVGGMGVEYIRSDCARLSQAGAGGGVVVTDDVIARVAEAIDAAEVGYHLRLTRMVDGESTYTLTYQGSGESFEFDDIDDGYAHIRQRKLRAQAENVIAALAPSPSAGEPEIKRISDWLIERNREHLYAEGLMTRRHAGDAEMFLDAALLVAKLSTQPATPAETDQVVEQELASFREAVRHVSGSDVSAAFMGDIAIISRGQLERLRQDAATQEVEPADLVTTAIDEATAMLESAGFKPDIESADPGEALLAFLEDMRAGMPDGPRIARTPPATPVQPTASVEGVARILRRYVRVDATGLSPAVVGYYITGFDEAAREIIASLTPAPTQGDDDRLLRQLRSLAVALHSKHYSNDAPNWQPLEDAEGLLSQIDNMTTGLSRTPSPAPVSAPATDGEVAEAARAVLAEARLMAMTMRRRRIFDRLADALSNPAPGHGEGVPTCAECGGAGTIQDRVDGDITCPECGYPTAEKPAKQEDGDV